MYFHWQNLNKDLTGKPRPGIPWQGRMWIGPSAGSLCRLCVAWNLPGRHPGVSVGWGGDEDSPNAHLGIPGLCDLWVGLTHRRLARLIGHKEREMSLRFFDGAVWWSLATPVNEWSSKTPRWRHGSWHPLDTILGRQKYSERTIDTRRVPVPMPEGVYEATVRMYEAERRRPRWPWPRRILRADVKPDKPIPFPGKGENSWDCGDDATYEMTTNARTPEEAVGHLVATVLRDRKQRGGGYGWDRPLQPEEPPEPGPTAQVA